MALTAAKHKLRDADLASVEDMLTRVPLDEGEKTRLVATMSQPQRCYHGLNHLAVLWRRHCQFGGREGFRAKEIEILIACALAYHDCVYEMEAKDNEEQSARVWLAASKEAPLAEEDRAWVAGTIRATADHIGYAKRSHAHNPAPDLRERARLWVLDLDLTPLGESRAIFNRNTEALRLEYAHLSDAEWRAHLAKFSAYGLSASRIYNDPELHEAFEARARENLMCFAPH